MTRNATGGSDPTRPAARTPTTSTDRAATTSAARATTTSTDRATTTTLSYVLALSITVLLASGLLIAAGATLESAQESTARDELRVVGQGLDSRMLAADRLASAGGETVVVEMFAPERVAGSGYVIEVVDDSPARVHLNATDVDVEVTVTVPTTLPVVETTLAGGDLQIVRVEDGGDWKLEVRSA